MLLLVQILGVVYILMGIAVMIQPNYLGAYVRFWMKDMRMYYGLVLAALISAAFIGIAPLARWSWVIMIFGILGITKCVVFLILGMQKTKAMLKDYETISSGGARLMGILVLLLGALLIYSG
jgi:hypothetical protein